MNTPVNPPGPKKLAASRGMVEAVKELAEMGSDNPRMPEAYFRDFLKVLYDPVTDVFDTSLWYRTFHTYRKSIDITDQAGNVILVCPPVMSTVQTKITPDRNDRRASISSIAGEAALHGRRHAALENQVMAQGLATYKTEVATDIVSRWRELLTHYGIIKPETTNTTGFTAESLLADDGEAL